MEQLRDKLKNESDSVKIKEYNLYYQKMSLENIELEKKIEENKQFCLECIHKLTEYYKSESN
uniref:Uncharacterized protein n=1 Tax=viral metagenome TaxID=1070528 RepID=A0A6C0AGN5_9ZZZZ